MTFFCLAYLSNVEHNYHVAWLEAGLAGLVGWGDEYMTPIVIREQVYEYAKPEEPNGR